MKYFLHDTNAFQDEKITQLFMEFGYEGLGLFYTTLEKLALQEKPVITSVLKKQLFVGKKLEKCWKFMETIEIISSNNGETFNKQLLNFSETFQIKKETNKKRISEWRKNQENAKNVTCYESVRNEPKVKESKVKESKVKERERKEEENHSPFELFLLENQIENNDALEFLSSEMWFESKAMQLKSQTDILIEKAKDFLVDIRHRDQIEGKQLPDLRSHFVSWFKLKREAEKPDKPVNYRLPTYD